MKSRLFIAISLPQTHRTSVESLQGKLNKLGMPVVWEKIEKVHLTLNYVGQIPKEEIFEIKRMIQKVANDFNQFTFDDFTLETLYKRHDESLIYLAPVNTHELEALQSRLVTELNTLKHPQPRKFLPHMTIGRLKRTDPVVTKQAVDKLIGMDISGQNEPLVVEKIILFESFVSRKGSYYQKVAEFNLGKASTEQEVLTDETSATQ